MKMTLARIRSILNTNLHYFVVTALITLILYSVLFYLNFRIDLPQLPLPQLFTLLFFLCPIVIYGLFELDQYGSGVIRNEVSTKTIKKNLFMTFGVLWVSLGSVLYSLPNPQSLLFAVSAMLSLLSLASLSKLVFVYARTL